MLDDLKFLVKLHHFRPHTHSNYCVLLRQLYVPLHFGAQRTEYFSRAEGSRKWLYSLPVSDRMSNFYIFLSKINLSTVGYFLWLHENHFPANHHSIWPKEKNKSKAQKLENIAHTAMTKLCRFLYQQQSFVVACEILMIKKTIQMKKL